MARSPFLYENRAFNSPYLSKVAIIDKDDRVAVPEKYFDVVKGIGQIIYGTPFSPTRKNSAPQLPDAKLCTSFCVADDVIATNAHCLLKSESRAEFDRSRAVFFIPQIRPAESANETETLLRQNMSTYLEHVAGASWRLAVFFGSYYNPKSSNAFTQDWAIAKLREPLCKGRVLNIETPSDRDLARASRENRVFMIGYHSDNSSMLPDLSGNCRIYSQNDRSEVPERMRRAMGRNGSLIAHDCDSVLGSSGSPILMETADGPKVIGINSGTSNIVKVEVTQVRRNGKIYTKRRSRFSHNLNTAIHARAFEKGIERFKDLTLLASLDEFKEVQTLLKKLGLYRLKVDGVLGPGTKRAINQYERRKGLIEIGVPTRRLLLLLREEFEPTDTAKY